MAQYGFFFDQSRCTSCYTCTVACKDWNNIPPGPVKWARMLEWEKGTFPNPRIATLFAPCYHCNIPSCLDACPSKAIYKEGKYGAVLVDSAKCQAAHEATGCRNCFVACPYGSPQFQSDAPVGSMSHCTMCIDKLEGGESPVCVTSCWMRALDFDTMDNLAKKYGTNRDLPDLPASSQTMPNVIFKPSNAKKQLIPYDTSVALQLLAKRDPFPAVYSQPSDATAVTDGLVGRSKLVLKPKNTSELMSTTINDEG